MKRLLFTTAILSMFATIPAIAANNLNTYNDICEKIGIDDYDEEISDFIKDLINQNNCDDIDDLIDQDSLEDINELIEDIDDLIEQNKFDDIDDLIDDIEEQIKNQFNIDIEFPTQITTKPELTTNPPDTTQETTRFPLFTTTEQTTASQTVTTEEQTETTTNAVVKPPVTTTQTTTQATTEKQTETTTQATTEKQTETTTQAIVKPTVTTTQTTEASTETTTQAVVKPTVATTQTTEASTETTTQAVVKPTVTTTQTTEASTETTTQSQSSYAKQVLDLVNAERTKNGLSTLTLNSSLSNVAQIKAEDMEENNYFSHTSPTYGSPFDMMSQFGITYSAAGENIAKGQKTAQEVVNAWMNSEGHRKNILSQSYTQMGIGYTGSNSNYWVQMFIG